MDSVQEGSPTSLPMTEQDREKVREQLQRLLSTHHFNQSRRYPPLLRFIVEETLAGRGELLKERLIGVRVFDRPADYDTASDPIVRVTIAEIRKRIAQYYHDEEHDAEIRIEMLPGRYAPEFRTRATLPLAAAVQRSPGAELVIPHAAEVLVAPPARSREEAIAPPIQDGERKRRRLPDPRRAFPLGLIAVVLLAFLLVHWLRHPALDDLWSPLLASQESVLFCVPTDVGAKRTPVGEPVEPDAMARGLKSSRPSGPTFLDYEALGENVVFSDMLAALRMSNVLALHHHEYHSKLNVQTTLEDLRQGPAILVGGLDNQWTMRALAPLQFHFAGSDEDRYWIANEKNPGFRDWSLDLKQKYGSVTRDYAIIARLHNEQTGQPQLIVAGIGMSGTAAAGEFVADAEHAAELRGRIGKGFANRDFEAVLSTDVVNGIAGAPRIMAVSVR